MNKKLRWRIVVVVAVTFCISIFAWYPLLATRYALWMPGFMQERQLRLGLDLQGGVQLVLRVNTDDAVLVEQARQTIDRRVNGLGVAEPSIAIQGAAGNEIVIQLPGMVDMDRAREVLGATAQLEWKLVEQGPASSREALLTASGGLTPAGTELLEDAQNPGANGARSYYLVRTAAGITGRDLRDARSIRDPDNQPAVGFSLTRDGATRFSQLTGENVGRHLAIVLDGRVQSAPQIEERIDGGEGYIRGRFTSQEAADLSLMLRAGALPASMTYLGGRLVGPSLGSASIHAGVVASLVGLALVAAFMLLYYNRTGLNAVISVAVNLLLLLGLMAYSGAALTLPGIAGLILTIGMGVDSNVLIFERIKEELATGRGVRAAIAAGFDRVFLTILDTHIASLIAAAFLFQFGTGAIRGFATTLTFGLLANIFTATFVSRTIFELEPAGRREARLRIQTFIRLFRSPHVDFYRWRRHALAFSTAVIVIGMSLIVTRGVPLGIEFSGGTVVTVKFAEPVSEEIIQNAIPGEQTVQRYGERTANEMLIRLPQVEGGEGSTLAQDVNRTIGALQTAGVPSFEVTGSEAVGPSVGADMRRKGVFATLASIGGITAYIALRFRPSFAAGAIAATFHDILVTVSFLAISGYDLSLNVVAAILTITGYSVNDTIVTFDRVRENLRTMAGAPLQQVVNAAVNQTLGRTVITAGTTMLAVLALFVFGGDVLRPFAFTMLIGVASGTYSTIFIASAISIMLSKTSRR